MSCEGHRLKFFERVQHALGTPAETLEKIYQSAKSRGAQAGEEERVTQKTQWLFGDMKLVGLKPPTHSADGLPKMASRAGYAAVFDYVRDSAQARQLRPQDFGVNENNSSAVTIYEYDWPLPISPVSLREKGGESTAAGFHEGFYCGKDEKRHVWFGQSTIGHYRALSAEQNKKLAAALQETLDKGLSPYEVERAAANLARKAAGSDYMYEYSPEERAQIQQWAAARDASGLLPDGYDENGFDLDGYNEYGYSVYGIRRDVLTQQGGKLAADLAGLKYQTLVYRTNRPRGQKCSVDIEGFDENGFAPTEAESAQDCDRFGFSRAGFRRGYSWTGYDEKGVTKNRKKFPPQKGYDAWGYDKKTGLTAPDKKGLRYNLIGWQYDPATGDCFDPQYPTLRMKHDGSYRFDSKLKKVVPKRSYVPGKDELARRVLDPAIRMKEHRSGGAPSLLQYTHLAGEHDYKEVYAMFAASRVEARWLRSALRAQDNPEASFFGVSLRCPKCGQFTGAKPHACPHYGGKLSIAFKDGTLAVAQPDMYRPYTVKGRSDPAKSFIEQYCDESAAGGHTEMGYEAFPESNASGGHFRRNLGLWAGAQFLGMGQVMRHTHLAPFLDGQFMVVEAPVGALGADFDPEFHGGALPGFHWRSGISADGYDPYGLHWLTGRSRNGIELAAVKSSVAIRMEIKKVQETLKKKGKDIKAVFENTYSRIASSLAGQPRRVAITEQGGPRAGMFFTNMKGYIQAEMYSRSAPGDEARTTENMLALKAGIYHELGHEEDTPLGVFRRVLDIANGKEQVAGLPQGAAGLVAEIYNIVEDGRMERVQSTRRRGVAAVLAADAAMNPRWDEKVGDDLPVSHQVMGMMLYRSLPFFRVRQEVFDAAPQRVRALYKQVEPLVDRGMRSPEDAFQASVEITRLLVEQDEDLKNFAQQMTASKSQGGKWSPQGNPSGGNGSRSGGATIIISAMPSVGAGVPADTSIPIPARGWGRDKQEDESGQGRPAGSKQEDESGQGQVAQGQQGDESAQGRPAGSKQEDESGQGQVAQGKQEGKSGQDGGSGRSASGAVSSVEPEPGEDFFSGVSGAVSVGAAMDSLLSDFRRGVSALSNSPIGKELQKPSASIPALEIENPARPDRPYIVNPLGEAVDTSLPTSLSGRRTQAPRASRKNPLNNEELRSAAKAEGARIARRLNTLRQSIQKKAHLQTSGSLDRKRFKRAMTGSDTVYHQNRAHDVTSLALSVQLDMSGSMESHIKSGELAASALALEEAALALDAEYMVSAFGTNTALIKSFGDERIPEERIEGMMDNDLGGTVAYPALQLALLGLRETKSANKLHVVMTDGDTEGKDASRRSLQEMRRNGIVPFGVFLSADEPRSHSSDQMNDLFGEGGWVRIAKLSDLSEVVAKRIEQIYRRVLATRG